MQPFQVFPFSLEPKYLGIQGLLSISPLDQTNMEESNCFMRLRISLPLARSDTKTTKTRAQIVTCRSDLTRFKAGQKLLLELARIQTNLTALLES